MDFVQEYVWENYALNAIQTCAYFIELSRGRYYYTI